MTAKLFKSTNPLTPTHIAQAPKLTLSKEASKSMGVGTYVPRRVEKNEAVARKDNLFKRQNYRTGDGDNGTYVPRPGSLVAFTLPSRGIGT